VGSLARAGGGLMIVVASRRSAAKPAPEPMPVYSVDADAALDELPMDLLNG